nr:MAG TPA: hypothetical protein [Caudoviricetes sp.]
MRNSFCVNRLLDNLRIIFNEWLTMFFIHLCQKISLEIPVLNNFTYWVFFCPHTSFRFCFNHLYYFCTLCPIRSYHSCCLLY